MHFRPATFDDAHAIAVLHAESWRVFYRGAYPDAYLDGDVHSDRLAVWTKRLAEPAANQYVVVADDGAKIIGFACAFGGDDPRWGTLVDNLHVSGAEHRRGTGTALMLNVAAWARAQWSQHGLYLWVLAPNVRAQRFYQHLGATDRGGETAPTPGGSEVVHLRYAWDSLADVTSARRSSTA